MVIKLLIAGGAAIAALASSAALADTPGLYAAGAISAGQLDQAERILQPVSQADASDPARLVNIATVYARTQRFAEARTALLRVQTLPEEQLDLGSGASLSSHRIAAAMLGRLDEGTRFSAR